MIDRFRKRLEDIDVGDTAMVVAVFALIGWIYVGLPILLCYTAYWIVKTLV